jgi:hypothetical protein
LAVAFGDYGLNLDNYCNERNASRETADLELLEIDKSEMVADVKGKRVDGRWLNWLVPESQ